MSEEHKQYATSAAATLEAHILSVHSAKNEAEWWANREILRLRAENYRLRKAFAEVKEIAESNDVLIMKRKALRRHLLEAVSAAAALKETGDD